MPVPTSPLSFNNTFATNTLPRIALQAMTEEMQASDPLWAPAFLEVAIGLIEKGARTRIVIQLTGLPKKRVLALYRALQKKPQPPGPILQAPAGFFVKANPHSPWNWPFHTAIFLACVDQLQQVMGKPLQRSWLLLAAYKTYQSLISDPSSQSKQLTINQAYALITHCRYMKNHHQAELRLSRCKYCHIRYATLVDDYQHITQCPVCTLQRKKIKGLTVRKKPKIDIELKFTKASTIPSLIAS
jgi:hypothetical protein